MKSVKADLTRMLPILAVVLCGILAYANTFQSSFHLDDRPNIVYNPFIRDASLFLDPSRLCAKVVPGSHEEFVCLFLPRRYVGYLSFAANYMINGLDVFGYHAVNLAVHCVNAVLIYALVSLTFSTPGMKGSVGSPKLVALFSALLFVAHPVQTQAVTYVVQRFTSLATLFYLGSVLCYARSRLSDSKTGGYLFYGLSLVSALMAMKTKEIAFTLPLAIVLYEVVFFEGRPAKRLLRLTPLLLMLSLIPLSLAGSARSGDGIFSGIGSELRVYTDMSRWEYFVTQMRVIATYLRLLVLPIGQNVDYDYPIYRSLADPEVLAACALHAALLGAGLFLLVRARQGRSGFHLIGFGILWFYLTLSVESSIIPIIDVIFEHRLYLPSVGAYVATAMSLSLLREALRQRGAGLERAVVPMCGVLVVALAAATIARNRVWRDEITLWSDVVQKSPMKARGYGNLAQAYQARNMPMQALDAYSRVIALDPRQPDAYNGRATIYEALGEFGKAEQDYTGAIALKPNTQIYHRNRGLLLTKTGDYKAAIRDFSSAIALNPKNYVLYRERGMAAYYAGELQMALEDFSAVLTLNPEDADAYNNRGTLLARKGKFREAIDDFSSALALKPGFAGFYLNRGRAKMESGALKEAIDDFTSAVTIEHGTSEAYLERGRAYALRGEIQAARADFRAACDRGSRPGCDEFLKAGAKGR